MTLRVGTEASCWGSVLFGSVWVRSSDKVWPFKVYGRANRFESIFPITGGRSSTSVNGDIAIQWERSNFDPSQNQNPLTDYDKTLHN